MKIESYLKKIGILLYKKLIKLDKSTNKKSVNGKHILMWKIIKLIINVEYRHIIIPSCEKFSIYRGIINDILINV